MIPFFSKYTVKTKKSNLKAPLSIPYVLLSPFTFPHSHIVKKSVLRVPGRIKVELIQIKEL